jgi:hypothetical protein
MVSVNFLVSWLPDSLPAFLTYPRIKLEPSRIARAEQKNQKSPSRLYSVVSFADVVRGM